MSWRGLKYKGVEVLFPDDWNAIVDALNDLKSFIDNIRSVRLDHAKQSFTLDANAEQTLLSVRGTGLVVVKLAGDGDGVFVVRIYVDGGVEGEFATNVQVSEVYAFDSGFELRLFNPASVSKSASSGTIRLRGFAKHAV